VVNEVYTQVLSDLGRHQDAIRISEEVRDAYRIMVDRAGNAPGQLRSLAMALRTNAEVRYNGGDYAGACRVWNEVLQMLLDLQRRGALTDIDRNNALAQTRDALARACNPPRAGLGPTADQ
jgi:serine/threonine-protein kinase